jgi:putative PEP-CTERM system TPR-repeat lipoprotein
MHAFRPASSVPRRWLAAGCLALLALAGCGRSESPDAQRFYDDALVRYQARDLNGAILQLKNALQADAGLVEARMLLGRALLDRGESFAAQAALTDSLKMGGERADIAIPLALTYAMQGRPEEILRLPAFDDEGLPAPVLAQLRVVKAFAHDDLGDPERALAALAAAREADPTLVDAWLAEVPIRLRAGMAAQALAAVDQARRIDPDSPELFYRYGTVLQVLGQLSSAMAAYERTLELDPAHVDARVARVGLLLDARRDDDAARGIETLVAEAPLEPRAWYFKAVLAERAGRLQDRTEALHQVLALVSPLPESVLRGRLPLALLKGQAHYGVGDMEQAMAMFEFVHRVQPGNGPVVKLLANTYLAQRNPENAINVLTPYLQSVPDDAQAAMLLASAQMASGRSSVAAGLMERALDSNESAALRTAYGLSLRNLGRSDDARAQLEAALSKDPADTTAAFALVGLYLENNAIAKARTLAGSLVKRNDANPASHYLLGEVRLRADDAAGARAAYARAIELDPRMMPALLASARLEAAQGQPERARALLETARTVDPRATQATLMLAELSAQQGQSADALRLLREGYAASNQRDRALALALLEGMLAVGEGAEAAALSERMVAAYPADLPVLVLRARVQLLNGDKAGARLNLTTAGRMAGYEPALQSALARLQLAADDARGAAYSVGKALDTEPDNVEALALQAEVEIRLGAHAEAARALAALRARAPGLAIADQLAGDLALAGGQPAEAIDAYRKALAAQPSSQAFMRLYGALRPQDPAAAQALADRWLAEQPDDLGARKLLAVTLEQQGDLVAARAMYEQARRLEPGNVWVLNNLANVLLRLQDAAGAKAAADEALARAPQNVAVLDTAGWSALQAGDVDRALTLLADAQRRRPDDPAIRYHLASALARKGQTAEARTQLLAALGESPAFDGRGDAEALLKSLP